MCVCVLELSSFTERIQFALFQFDLLNLFIIIMSKNWMMHLSLMFYWSAMKIINNYCIFLGTNAEIETLNTLLQLQLLKRIVIVAFIFIICGICIPCAKKSALYSVHAFPRCTHIFIIYGMNDSSWYSILLNNYKIYLPPGITVLLCSIDVIVTSSKIPFSLCLEKRINSVLYNNFSKFKRIVISFGKQH